MCSQRVSSIFAEIGLDSSKFTKGAKDVLGGLGDILGSFGKLPGVLGIVGTALGFAITEMQKMEQAAVASAKEDAKLGAVLLSTGYAAGMKADQLDSLATSISKNIGMDDELVKAGEAVLLTFTNVSQKVFPDTMRAAADMAAVLGGDLNGKITMIGKAMNDFDGYKAMKRAGVVFSDEQEVQIQNFKDANDLMGYQALVLQELQKEYGNAAKAINDAGDGSENYKIAVENLQEAIGERMVPAQRAQNERLTEYVDKQARAVNIDNQRRAILQELGIFYSQQTGYVRDYINLTAQEVDGLINEQQAIQASTDRWQAMADSVKGVGQAAEMTEAQLQEMNQTSKDMLSITEKLTGIHEDYEKGLQRVANTEYKTADERIAAIKEVEAAHELATQKIVFGYMEQQLAVGGLTTKESDFLLQQGVKWGIYSQTAVDEMRKIRSEWEGFQLSDKNAFINISTNYGNSPVTLKPGANTNNTTIKAEKYAMGGSFTIGGAGYENFNMGGVATASPGEVVNVSKGDNMAALLSEMQEVKRGLDKLPRELSVAILERAGQIGMS